ncbi:MAG TPA: GatB/YqeY domain-containing protein [Leucothrix mucor]|nr:GatB/YqeY domain-containing protein [Leucothrix mucor]
MSELKKRITEDMKSAMRNKEKLRLLTVRTILAAIKQQEVDTRLDLDDTDVLAILDKMCKQRRESITQFSKASRSDLVEKEEAELEVIQIYLPEPLTDDELIILISDAMSETGANSMRDMGKVMSYIKPKAQGRADMGKVSGMIKSQLSA